MLCMLPVLAGIQSAAPDVKREAVSLRLMKDCVAHWCSDADGLFRLNFVHSRCDSRQSATLRITFKMPMIENVQWNMPWPTGAYSLCAGNTVLR